MALQEANTTGDPDLDEIRRLVSEHGEDTLFPPLDGTAFFLLICRINHSCAPNVAVRYSCHSTREGAELSVFKEERNNSIVCGDGPLLDAQEVLSGTNILIILLFTFAEFELRYQVWSMDLARQ